MKKKIQAVFLFLVFCVFFPTVCLTAEISREVARQVAENYLNHYQEVCGEWAQSDHPNIVGYQLVEFNNLPVGHNFIVSPSGHILVAYWDEFSPVLLYSTVSQLDPERVGETGSIASWILPEIFNTYEFIKNNRAALDVGITYSETRVARAWEWLNKPIERFSTRDTSGDIRYATAGPLLTTIWDQGSPYNQYTPSAGTCTHTWTGCVATAWAQLLKYWNWPDRGTGSHSYLWSGTTLSANFDHAYNWSSMPNQLTASSTSAEKDAVARLISDIGIATNMDYGCDSSGTNAYADEVLDVYFKYKSSMQKIARGSYTAAQWFNLFRTELDAAPARPVVLSIFGTAGGHEVIVDGYQTGTTDKVHVNLGWSGSYNGFYDVTNNFTTGSYTWRASSQIIVTHIEPNTSTPTPTPTPTPIPTPSSAACDFNGDGKSDILWRNTSSGQNIVWFMNGATPIGSANLPTVPDTNWTIVGVGDFNGDGTTDILWRNKLSGENTIWFMNGTGASIPAVHDLTWTIVGVGDFNGDGKSDILWRNTSSGENTIWFMKGATPTGAKSLPTVPDTNWTIVGIGDFNGDGKPDILWRHQLSGVNTIWLMNGATPSGITETIPTVSDTNWTIVGVGDFNGDGTTDILWRNKLNGQGAIWFMNGTGAYIPTVSDLTWTIVNH